MRTILSFHTHAYSSVNDVALLYTATCRGVSPRNQRMYGHRRSATLQLVVALTSPLLFFSCFLYPSTMPFSLSRFSVCIVPSHPISLVAAWNTRYFLKNIRLRLTSLRFYIFLLSCSISPDFSRVERASRKRVASCARYFTWTLIFSPT